MFTVTRPKYSRMTWAAAAAGAAGTLAEAFIGTATLLAGFNRGWFDVVGTALGVVALITLRRHPLTAALIWLLTLPLLYSGGMLVSVACLPVLLLPVLAAALAFFAWRQQQHA